MLYDAVALGELLIDFTQAGTTPDGKALFQQNAGGAVANVMANLSALGHRTAFITKVGNDLCGGFLKDTLDRYGIDTRSVAVTGEAFTTLAFVAIDKSGERSFSFSRNPGADTLLRYSDIDESLLKRTKIFHVGSLSTTADPARSATFRAIETASEAGAVISFDPNYRASLWPDEETASVYMRKLLEKANVVKMAECETGLMTGYDDPETALRCIYEGGADLAVVTMSEKGAMVMADGITAMVPTERMDPVDTTGAGDAFWAGFLHCLIESGKLPSEVTIDEAVSFAGFGNKKAAECIGRIGAMPPLE